MTARRRTSLRTRLTRTLAGLGLVSVILLAAVNFFVVRELLDRGARDQLVTLRDLRRDTIEEGLGRLLDRVAVLGADPGVAVALRDLEQGYDATDDELSDTELDRLREEYAPIVQRYDDAGVDRPSVDELLPTSASGRYVQYRYLAENAAEPDERRDLVDAGDGSPYSAAHAEHHEFLRTIADSVGAADLKLVGLSSGDVVYSVDKYIDLGTAVVDGPYADTGLGSVWDQLGGSAIDAGVIADSEFYLPNSAEPVVQVAAAVRVQSEVVGAVVVTFRTDIISDVVTAQQQWELLGLGDTGAAYIVGSDLRFRTIPRGWYEDPDAYLERFRDVIGDERAAGLIEFTGSPVLIQEVDNAAVRSALEEEPFVGRVDDHLGRATLAAAAPLDVGDLGWIVVAEQQTSETRDELERFLVSILILLAILLPILAVVGLVLARVLARPVQPLVDAAGRIADGDYRADVPEVGRNELGDVGRQLQAVALELSEQETSIAAEEERITTMLESVLPAAIVDRVRSGERELSDVVDSATVIAITVGGFPEPSGTEQEAVLELTDRLTEAANAVAAQHGIERVQVALEQQLFVAGRGRPDSAVEEAAAFATDLLGRLRTVGAEQGVAISASAGLSAGLVASGVLGSQRLSFGLWGDAVGRALELSRLGEAGQVVADPSVADELDDEEVGERVPGDDVAYVIVAAGSVVSGPGPDT